MGPTLRGEAPGAFSRDAPWQIARRVSMMRNSPGFWDSANPRGKDSPSDTTCAHPGSRGRQERDVRAQQPARRGAVLHPKPNLTPLAIAEACSAACLKRSFSESQFMAPQSRDDDLRHAPYLGAAIVQRRNETDREYALWMAWRAPRVHLTLSLVSRAREAQSLAGRLHQRAVCNAFSASIARDSPGAFVGLE